MDAVKFLKKARDFCKARRCEECEICDSACYGGICHAIEQLDDDDIDMLVNTIEEVEGDEDD